jgi:small-conductance mechanosensitive channel
MCAEGLDLGGHVAMQGLITDVFGPLTARDSQLKGLLIAGLALLVALIAGWLLGRLARALFILLFSRRIEELSRQLGYKQLETSLRLRVSLATLVGWAVQAGVILLAVLLLGTIYYPLGVESWLAQSVGYLPTILIALTLLIVGLVLSQLLSDLTFTAARAAKRGDAAMLGTAVRIGVVLLALAAALLATVFVTVVLVATLAATSLAVGLAIGLGSADYVRDLLAGRTIRQQIRPGQRVEVDDVSGVVIECGPSSTLIAMDDGKRLLVSNRLIAQKRVVLG